MADPFRTATDAPKHFPGFMNREMRRRFFAGALASPYVPRRVFIDLGGRP